MYSKCQKCGRKLTDPESIERGYGPECWGSILPHYSIEQEEPEESIPGQMTIEDFLGGLKQYIMPQMYQQKYVLNVGKSIVLARHYQEKITKQ